MTTVLEAVEIIRNRWSELPAKDQRFARDIIAHRITPGREKWILIMAERITAPKPVPVERTKVEIGKLDNIIKMFDFAKRHVKEPAITLALADMTVEPPQLVETLRLNVAASHHRVPGSINVKGDDWYGRILRDGNFEISPKYEDSSMVSVIELLQRFCDDPVTVATEFGRLTGRCCFCYHPLKDERSTEVGYGPTCAEHHGLPWGAKKFTFAAVQAPAPEVKVHRSSRKVRIS